MSSNNVNILVNNRKIHKYHHEGNTFVEGRKGSEYAIQIQNPFYYKGKAVVFVDNVNVLTGNDSSEYGYIIDPKQEIIIPGWWIDKNTIAKFNFSEKKDGYQRDVGLVGVIGVRLYLDKRPLPTDWPLDYYPYYKRYPFRRVSIHDDSVILCSSPSSEQNEDLATGWGDEKEFKTENYYGASFRDTPEFEVVIYYDTQKNLEARGIMVKPLKDLPRAFPDFGCPPPISK